MKVVGYEEFLRESKKTYNKPSKQKQECKKEG